MATPWSPVPFRDVRLAGRFWGPRLEVNRQATIPHEYLQCKETGRIDAFGLDWRPGAGPEPHIFWDSDVAKWLEAASYSLAAHPDPELDSLVDGVVALVAGAQQADGYLNVHFTVVEPERRWSNLRDAHELYCAGHMIEAGVAHFAATGKRALLEVVCRYADYIGTVFGRGPGQKRGYPGHEEIELALIRLHRATGEGRYLALAQYFVDERGQRPRYFDLERGEEDSDPARSERHARYNQSHLPVREQAEAVGHSVRAMYLYCAMADLAGETGDQGLRAALERLWEDVTGRHMYITGGVGSSAANEGFTGDYDLPNPTAYAETCANVGLVFWAHRLAQLECDGRYTDVLERALYNGVISGVSADGRRFFYANPLASDGAAHRQDWFGCACCPPNVARLLASLGQYVYSTSQGEVAVHLYAEGTAELDLQGRRLSLRQETDYPWNGSVALTVGLASPARFGLRLRLPGWCRGATLAVQGRPVEGEIVRGYARIEREWHDGDRVELDLPMPVERIHAHPDVAADFGATALQRGPVVYCFEAVDNPGVRLRHALLPRGAAFAAALAPEVLGGVVVVEGEAVMVSPEALEGGLYRTRAPETVPVRLRGVPYAVWDNRAPGAMRVWLPEI